jgi:sugar phosphate isomerase/epimerase
MTKQMKLWYFPLWMILTGLACLIGCSQNKDVFDPVLGVCTSFSNAPLLNYRGVDYIEESVQHFLVPQEPEEVFKKKLQDSRAAGMKIYACNGFLPGNLKCVGLHARHDDILQYAETAFRRSRDAGIKIIVFGSGSSRRIPDGYSKVVAEAQVTSLLRRMGPVAEEFGIVVAIEPLRKEETNFLNSVSEGLDMVRAVNHSHIRLLVDFYHMIQENEGPDAIVMAGSAIHHCHIAEKEKRTPPGTLGDDFRPYFQALRQTGYSGGVSIECRWENMEEQITGAISELKKQIQSLEDDQLNQRI